MTTAMNCETMTRSPVGSVSVYQRSPNGAMPGDAMPKGPRGEKRPGDVIGAAIMVAKLRHYPGRGRA